MTSKRTSIRIKGTAEYSADELNPIKELLTWYFKTFSSKIKRNKNRANYVDMQDLINEYFGKEITTERYICDIYNDLNSSTHKNIRRVESIRFFIQTRLNEIENEREPSKHISEDQKQEFEELVFRKATSNNQATDFVIDIQIALTNKTNILKSDKSQTLEAEIRDILKLNQSDDLKQEIRRIKEYDKGNKGANNSVKKINILFNFT